MANGEAPKKAVNSVGHSLPSEVMGAITNESNMFPRSIVATTQRTLVCGNSLGAGMSLEGGPHGMRDEQFERCLGTLVPL